MVEDEQEEGEGDHKRQPKLFLGKKREKKRSLSNAVRPTVTYMHSAARRTPAPLITACLMRAQDWEGRKENRPTEAERTNGDKEMEKCTGVAPPTPFLLCLPLLGQPPSGQGIGRSVRSPKPRIRHPLSAPPLSFPQPSNFSPISLLFCSASCQAMLRSLL